MRTTTPSAPSRRVRALAIAATALFGTAASSLTVSTATAAVSAPATCPASPLLVNTGFNTLLSYSTSGTLLDSIDVQRAYGDIAMTPAGVLYGISYPSAPTTLYTIDPATGAEIASIALTGAILDPENVNQPSPALNSLSALPNGDLLVGAAGTRNIFRISPATGVTTLFGGAFPAGITSAGDFLSLPNGDLLAVGSDSVDSPLYLIHPDNSITQIGVVPKVFGAAQSAGIVYLAGATGDIMRIDTLPTTPSTAPLPYTTVARTGRNFYGATSVGDAGTCSPLQVTKAVSAGNRQTVQPGQVVTYTLTFDNTQGTAPVTTFYTDDLTKVIDDATVTSAPAQTSGSGLTVGPISTSLGVTTFPVTGVLPAGARATVSYSVTVANPGTGDRVMTNFVVPAGDLTPASCETTNPACTVNPVSTSVPTTPLLPTAPSVTAPKLSLRKTANRSRVKPGQKVQYRLTAANTGTGAAEHVELCDALPDHLSLVTSKQQLAKVNATLKHGQLCWKIGTLKAGQRLTRSFTVRVDRDATVRRIVNRATLDRTNVPGIDARAQRTVQVTPVAPRVSTSKVTG